MRSLKIRWAVALVNLSVLALTGCGGGGGGTPAQTTPSGQLSTTDDQTLQWVFAEILSTTPGELTTDAVRFQLYATAHPELRRDVTGNSFIPLREPGTSITDVRAYAQGLWWSKGRIHRLSLRGDVQASDQLVSTSTQVCILWPLSSGADTLRADSWLNVWLADSQGQCSSSEQRQGVVAADAGPQTSVLDLGKAGDSWVVGTLGAADGGRGPLLIQNWLTPQLSLVDPSGQGALGTQGTTPLPLPWAGLTSTSRVSFNVVPVVGTQKGVLIVDGHIWVLDWQGGRLTYKPAQTTLAATSRTRVTGSADGRYVIATPDQVFVLNTDGSTTPNLVRFSALPTGMTAATKVTVRNGCALVGRVGTDSLGNSNTLDLLALDLGTLATVPLQTSGQDAAFTAQTPDTILWVSNALDSTVGALWRHHCNTGRGHVLVNGAVQLNSIHQHQGGTDRLIAAMIQPPDGGFATAQGARTYSGASLVGYAADTDQLVNWGTLPSPNGLQIIGLGSRDRTTQVGDTLLFDGVAVDAQGGNHGVLVSVQALVPHSLKVLATNLPAP